ncbi:MAG: peptide-methionine (R)-S-oxide reductase, partial [Desulfobacterales bacterium]|nr:peptide-methionine (R)-S-oxide reductase [Desulfobacterales bacterium]
MIRFTAGTPLIIVLLLGLVACNNQPHPTESGSDMNNEVQTITKTEEQWRQVLTEEEYRVARESGTERAFTGRYWDTKAPGI